LIKKDFTQQRELLLENAREFHHNKTANDPITESFAAFVLSLKIY
jgi:hypothetical protein